MSYNKKNADIHFIELLKEKEEKLAEELKHLVTSLEKSDSHHLEELPLTYEPKICKVASLDGGAVPITFNAVQLILATAAGTVFEKDESSEWVREVDIVSFIGSRNLSNFKSIIMFTLELKVANQLMEQNPDIVILDGSIYSLLSTGVPIDVRQILLKKEQIDKRRPSYQYYQKYKEFSIELDKLLRTAIEKNILLIGVSKDSRLQRILPDELMETTSLTDVAYVLRKFEDRVGYVEPFPMPYEFDPAIVQLWNDEGIIAEEVRRLNASYFVLKSNSIPFRVDFLNQQSSRIEEISSILEAYHDGTGFIMTSQLVHTRAHIKQELVNLVKNRIYRMFSSGDTRIYKSLFGTPRRERIQ